jgi:hypothetical protein
LNQHARNIGLSSATSDPRILADFKYSLGQRYQQAFGILESYIIEDSQTFTTANGTQYYYYPPGTVSIDSLTITIGSLTYTLYPIYSAQLWNWYNALQIQPTSIPQFYFPRQYDFGIWPIPTATYTGQFQRFYRDRNLLVEDYTDGTVTCTLNSSTLTGSGTTFTPGMVGRWFTVTNTATPGEGLWYRISAYTSATSLTLQSPWIAATATGQAYRIGESPELPEDGQGILPFGTASDYYSGLRKDPDNGTKYDNMYWTGNFANTSRRLDDKNITGGLIGLHRKYADRDRSHIVMRRPTIYPPSYKIFAQSIS